MPAVKVPSDQPKKAIVVAQQITTSGPLPPPNDLSAYDKVVRGAAERIIVMAEDEQAHRHSIEKSSSE